MSTLTKSTAADGDPAPDTPASAGPAGDTPASADAPAGGGRRLGLPRRDFGAGEEGERRYANNVLLLVSLGTITTALSGGLLNISLPVLVRHFNATSLEASWLLLGAMLASTSTIIMFGRLADMFGRLPFYLAGMVTMTVSSLLAGFAPNIMTLIILRMAQSVGSAMLLSNLAAILTVTVRAERLPKLMGIYMSALSAATLAGPPVGSLIADTAGWRWLFWSQAPLGLFCLIWGAMTFRPMPPTGARARLDLPGAGLVAVVLTAILIALSQLQKQALTSPVVLISFAVFLAALPVFAFVELRTRAPLVDLRLFRRATVAASNSAMFFGNMARFSIILLFGLYFQAVDGNSTLVAALKVLPMPIFATLSGLFMGRVSRWGSDRAIATCAAAVSGFGTLLLLLATLGNAPLWAVWGSMIIIGAGGGVFMPANTTAILQEVPRDQLGVVNAVRMMLMSSGSLVATALSLAIVTASLPHSLRDELFRGSVSRVSAAAIHDLNSGYARALIVLVALNVIGVVSAYISQRAARSLPGASA
ncbi:MAG: MFS transporter [Frankiaceae bacterium]|jgi:MFS family permease|nr:MFS transporter [Frankiaceae bacterium]